MRWVIAGHRAVGLIVALRRVLERAYGRFDSHISDGSGIAVVDAVTRLNR